MATLESNTSDLENDLFWIQKVIEYQLGLIEGEDKQRFEEENGFLPSLPSSNSYYGKFILENKLTPIERGLLIIGLAIYYRPLVFNELLKIARNNQMGDSRIGGVINNTQMYFIPTGETAIFLLTNGSLKERMMVLDVLNPQHWLFEKSILSFDFNEYNLPLSYYPFSLTKDYLEFFSTGKFNSPDYSTQFPASKVEVTMDWDDVVISDKLRTEINDLEYWIQFEDDLFNKYGWGKKIKRGYKVIFHGPSGTGKTMVAGLIGKKYGKEVYRVDVSQLSSKYIGETEKNIENLFQQGKNKNWILFFDEGETLFSKRSNSGGNNERYGNQQVGFLLQKIEDHPGIVILATNLKGNLDEAFLRRFQKMIYFELPDETSRWQLWSKSFENTIPLAPDIDLKSIAKEFELVGGQIINVVKQIIIRELGVGSKMIQKRTLLSCIREELQKK